MKKIASKFRRSAFAVGTAALLMLSFQNCSNGFQSAQLAVGNANRGSNVDVTPLPPNETPDSSATATPTPVATATPDETPTSTPTPGETPTPTPTPAQKVSQIFVGSNSKIKSFRLDHGTDTLTTLADISLPGQSPGWFAFDASSSHVYAADAQGGNLNRFSYDATSGALTLENTLPFLKRAVHLGFQKTATGWNALGASYDDARFARYEISADGRTSTAKNIMEYDAGSKTHSSSFDTARGLVFVANLGEGKVVVYKDVAGDLRLVTRIPVVNPRIVMYDATFDKLYVMTEAYSDGSYLKIYGISPSTQNGFDFTEIGSFKMALAGGDLKIDHVNRYIGATVREEGQQGVWAIPVTSEGLLDSQRTKIFMGIQEFAPRSLQISSDGRYYVVACDSAKNTNDLVIFKMTYDAKSALKTHDVLKKIDLGTGSYLSNFML
jgi:6-phosphogluconolactonase (cycloisomerase 2 family)